MNREHLLQLEQDVLGSGSISVGLCLTSLDRLNEEISMGKKTSFSSSLKYAKLVKKSHEWFKSEQGQSSFDDSGLCWTNEDFYTKALLISKAHFYRVMKVAKIQAENPSLVRAYSNECDAEELNGNNVERSIAELIKRANGTSSVDGGDDKPKTVVSFSVKKDLFEDGKGISIRILDDGKMETNGELGSLLTMVDTGSIEALISSFEQISDSITNNNNNN